MSLIKYRSKRDFKETQEPKGKVKKSGGSLRFVVQKHDARHLHYDFRLEHQGVLLSWAVPKGPSMDPRVKRLAIHVEDHPLDYQYFEGTIPKGSYGAGTVEIWDKGTYSIPGADSKKEEEKIISRAMEKGHLDFNLFGEELQGAFALIRIQSGDAKDQWLLIKKEDKKIDEEPISKIKGKKAPFPSHISPMLATLAAEAFDSDEWLFEIKWDGFRAIAYKRKKEVILLSRNDLEFNNRFRSIVEALEKVPSECILDGELIVMDEKGKAQFQLMQNYQKTGKGDIAYYIFDILYKDGEDLRELPLIERKGILKSLLASIDSPLLRYSDHVLTKGKEFFRAAAKNGLEGIMAKRLNSTYHSRRGKDWLKIKSGQRQEVVIGGFTEPRGERKHLGALLVGIYKAGKLNYAGHVGGGFSTALLKDVYEQLKPLEQAKCPFYVKPKPNEKVTWVKPKLLCEVSFAEWTEDNIMRQPIFHGLRNDKETKKVVKEEPIKIKDIPAVNNTSGKTGNEEFTHLDKIYWPEEKYTKGDLIEYYREVAPYILPYLKDRPIVMHRYPNGITGQSFYQKDLISVLPKGIKTATVAHEEKDIHYLLIDDVKSLLFAVNLGSIDIHPFISRVGHLEAPDYCVIDLDPQGVEWKQLIEVALTTHELLENLGVPHYCKTSGGRGLHIYIPLGGKYTFEQSKQFAHLIVAHVNQALPKTTSLERSPQKRKKQVYLDFLQNRTAQTVVAPYSVRPRPGATVSTPLDWDEVNNKLDPSGFTIKTVLKRFKKVGDIFKPVLGKGIDMAKVLKKFNV